MRFKKIFLLVFIFISLILIVIEVRNNIRTKNNYLQTERHESKQLNTQANDTSHVSIDSLWQDLEFID